MAENATPIDEFEVWLRTVCFQKPTPEAYDLAKSAWKEVARRRGELLREVKNDLEDNLFCPTDCNCYQRRLIARISAEFKEG